jgi:hypothetical protein
MEPERVFFSFLLLVLLINYKKLQRENKRKDTMNNEVRKDKRRRKCLLWVYALEGAPSAFWGVGEKDEDDGMDECLPRRVCEQGHRVHC